MEPDTGATDRAALIRDRRVQYETAGLDRAGLAADPVAQWHVWHQEAFAADVAEPNAMTVATVDSDGLPDARVLLVRGVDERGLVFYTNYQSAKGRQLDERPVAAAVFAWLDLHRQVRVRGRAERVDGADSDAYFASRPRGSQLGAWASPQSEPIDDDRASLDEAVVAFDEGFADEVVPRPPHWGGWRLVPVEWEFWQGRPSRLHDRWHYRRAAPGAPWTITRLAP